MSLSLSMHTYANHLDMYGEPDPTSAYSLSGHVAISLSSSSSFFDRRRTARFLLRSLSLTFEGQSEIFLPSVGYSAVRLCSITRELAPSQGPLELSNEGHEDSKEPCVWNIIFNMTVPGWLPATSVFGEEELGVRYSLYATAKLVDLDESRSHSWALLTLCAPFRSKTKTARARHAVELRRFVAPPSPDSPVIGTINYLVNNPNISTKDGENGKRRIPPEVLAKIQAVLSVPEFVDMGEKNMTVTLKMRTNGLEREECERIRVLDVVLSLRQVEKCRNRPSTNYQNRYPLPPPEQQPPNNPLFESSHIATIYEVGIIPLSDRRDSITRTFSLIPAHESGHFKFDENKNRIFADEGSTDQSRGQVSWYNLELNVPFAMAATIDDDWDIPAVLRPTASTALYDVYHEATVDITCSYTFPDSDEVAREKLNFVVPITFGKVAPPPPQPALPPSISRRSASQDWNTPSLPVVEPYAPTLPVYSQLYDANGERKVDYSVPLPLYTPPSPDNETADTMSSRRMSLIEVDLPLEESQTRRKGDSIPQYVEEHETEDAETAPLLGTSTV